MNTRTASGEGIKPRFAPHVRFKFDRRRGQWIVLAPERLLLPDENAVEILKRCTGEATLADIIDQLSVEFDAPRGEIAVDVLELVRDLADKGILSL